MGGYLLSLPPYFAMAQFRSSFAPRLVMGVWWAWVVEGRWMGVCPPRGDGTMVTWEGDHMTASMSHPCAVGGLPRPSPAWLKSGGGGVCVVFMLLRAIRG